MTERRHLPENFKALIMIFLFEHLLSFPSVPLAHRPCRRSVPTRTVCVGGPCGKGAGAKPLCPEVPAHYHVTVGKRKRFTPLGVLLFRIGKIRIFFHFFQIGKIRKFSIFSNSEKFEYVSYFSASLFLQMHRSGVVDEVLFRLCLDPVLDCFDRHAHAVGEVVGTHSAL